MTSIQMTAADLRGLGSPSVSSMSSSEILAFARQMMGEIDGCLQSKIHGLRERTEAASGISSQIEMLRSLQARSLEDGKQRDLRVDVPAAEYQRLEQLRMELESMTALRAHHLESGGAPPTTGTDFSGNPTTFPGGSNTGVFTEDAYAGRISQLQSQISSQEVKIAELEEATGEIRAELEAAGLSLADLPDEVFDGEGRAVIKGEKLETAIDLLKQRLNQASAGNEMDMLEIQDLVQRRSSVLTLASQMTASFTQSANQIIGNVG